LGEFFTICSIEIVRCVRAGGSHRVWARWWVWDMCGLAGRQPTLSGFHWAKRLYRLLWNFGDKVWSIILTLLISAKFNTEFGMITKLDTINNLTFADLLVYVYRIR